MKLKIKNALVSVSNKKMSIFIKGSKNIKLILLVLEELIGQLENSDIIAQSPLNIRGLKRCLMEE